MPVAQGQAPPSRREHGRAGSDHTRGGQQDREVDPGAVVLKVLAHACNDPTCKSRTTRRTEGSVLGRVPVDTVSSMCRSTLSTRRRRDPLPPAFRAAAVPPLKVKTPRRFEWSSVRAIELRRLARGTRLHDGQCRARSCRAVSVTRSRKQLRARWTSCRSLPAWRRRPGRSWRSLCHSPGHGPRAPYRYMSQRHRDRKRNNSPNGVVTEANTT